MPLELLAWMLCAAQEDLTVLRPEDAAPKMLYRYLEGQARKALEARRTAIESMSAEAFRQRQRNLRAKLVESLGGFPARTPLNAKVVGRISGAGYSVEKVVYETRPDHPVPALLWLPEGRPPFPGVLVPCGHAQDAKAFGEYQRISMLLAKNGIAALCFDPLGQGERVQLLGGDGKPLVRDNSLEHTMIGIGALLVGRSGAAYTAWDCIRGLDYLASRPEVDPSRLGVTGNSGGGAMTGHVMALDDRVVAAAPDCSVTNIGLERLFATFGPCCTEESLPGQVALGMDQPDLITLRAPDLAALLLTASRDFFDIQGCWDVFREAKRAYGLLGHGERVDLFEFNDTHGFSRPRREAAVRWMRRWLLRTDDAPVEGELQVFPERELRCTATGQVLSEFKGKSAFDLNAEAVRELAAERARRSRTNEDLLRQVRIRIGLPAAIEPARRTEIGSIHREAGTFTKLLFDTEPGIRLPALLFSPGNLDPSLPLILFVPGDGKTRHAAKGGRIEALSGGKQAVLALDVRGMGELTPPPVSWARTCGDLHEALLGIYLNRPLLGQRVFDIAAVVAQGAPSWKAGIHLVGTGAAGPIALHVAALDARITELTIEDSIVSWGQVVRTPLNYDQLSNVVPGVLKDYDLPELAGTLAPRRLTVSAPLFPLRRPVPPKEAEEAYAPCAAAYARLGGPARFTLRD